MRFLHYRFLTPSATTLFLCVLCVCCVCGWVEGLSRVESSRVELGQARAQLSLVHQRLRLDLLKHGQLITVREQTESA